jgi:hypothetical protein
MRRTILLPGILGLAFSTSLPARADFQIGQTAAEPPIVLGSPAMALPPRAYRSPRARVAAPGFTVARGFGQAIPLRFAARQIVPPAITVRYAPGVDQDAEVDWTGDAPWNRVLLAAVQPLGLHVTSGVRSVLISR